MAEKRMFSKKIIDTDWFMDMPATTQNLYFHLSMRADDDGFIASPKRIIKLIGASEDDYRLLVAKHFVIPFESGVSVITDWRINNYLRNDRYTETIYKEEKEKLLIEESGKYKLGIPLGIPEVSTDILLSNSNTNTKTNTNEKKKGVGKGETFTPPTLEEVREYAKSRNSKVNPDDFYNFFTADNDVDKHWIDSKGNKVKNWKQKFVTWESFQKKESPTKKEEPQGMWEKLDEVFKGE